MSKKTAIITIAVVIGISAIIIGTVYAVKSHSKTTEKTMDIQSEMVSDNDDDLSIPCDVVDATAYEITSEVSKNPKKSNSKKSNSKKSNSKKPTSKNNSSKSKDTQSYVGRQEVTITFCEGETLTQIFNKIAKKEVCSFSSLMETAAKYDYSYYPLIASRPNNTRAFKLEGYLYPDTYQFYKGQKPQDVIGRFLRNGKVKIAPAQKQKAANMGRSMDQILTVASLIEKEGSKPSEVSNVAAVIYNRLNKGMQLQMDSSIYYIERHVKPYISGNKNRYNSLYNTYKCSALPAGPICNPGTRTINAALNPSNVDYLYFCHDKNANYYYASTYEEHLKNIEKCK